MAKTTTSYVEPEEDRTREVFEAFTRQLAAKNPGAAQQFVGELTQQLITPEFEERMRGAIGTAVPPRPPAPAGREPLPPVDPWQGVPRTPVTSAPPLQDPFPGQPRPDVANTPAPMGLLNPYSANQAPTPDRVPPGMPQAAPPPAQPPTPPPAMVAAQQQQQQATRVPPGAPGGPPPASPVQTTATDAGLARSAQEAPGAQTADQRAMTDARAAQPPPAQRPPAGASPPRARPPMGGPPPVRGQNAPPTSREEIFGRIGEVRRGDPSAGLQRAQRAQGVMAALQSLMGITGSVLGAVDDPMLNRMAMGVMSGSQMIPTGLPMARYRAREAEAERDRQAAREEQTARTSQQQADTQSRYATVGERNVTERETEGAFQREGTAEERARTRANNDPNSPESARARQMMRDAILQMPPQQRPAMTDELRGALESGSAVEIERLFGPPTRTLLAGDAPRPRGGGGGGGRGARVEGNTPEEIRANIHPALLQDYEDLLIRRDAVAVPGEPVSPELLERQRSIAELVNAQLNAGKLGQTARAAVGSYRRTLDERQEEAAQGIISSGDQTWHMPVAGRYNAQRLGKYQDLADATNRIRGNLARLARLRQSLGTTQQMQAVFTGGISEALSQGMSFQDILDNPSDVVPPDYNEFMRIYGQIQNDMRMLENTGVPQQFELQDIRARIPTPGRGFQPAELWRFATQSPQNFRSAAHEYVTAFGDLMESAGFEPGAGAVGPGQRGATRAIPTTDPRGAQNYRFGWVDASGQRHVEQAPAPPQGWIEARAAGRQTGRTAARE